jgi:ubiquinol oxidase
LSQPAPQIAIDYWYLKKDAKMIDVILAIRADEAGHRMVNNTLAGLKSDDYNPFAYADAPPSLSGTKWGLDREEAVQYFEKEDAARRAKSHTPKHTDAEGPFAGRDGTSA